MIHRIEVECNTDEDTYALPDMFDCLSIIGRLKNKGLTKAEIGKRIRRSREQVKHYVTVLNSIGPEVLDSAKVYQTGRVPVNGTNVPDYNFTEGWFRNSGIYDLDPE